MLSNLKSCYRTHTCGELHAAYVGHRVVLSGWVHRKRNHGGILFMDLRDHYGLTQLVAHSNTANTASSAQFHCMQDEQYEQFGRVSYESVITVTGIVVERSLDTVNRELPTGNIEIVVEKFVVQSVAQPLPMSVNSDQTFPEELRLEYRFLDLRREKLHKNIVLRNAVVWYFRQRMHDAGFHEFQTPILTASSPEGARDFLVPSRLYPGKFYALPQAPQQFKQMLMASGFDRYFQIAPCFRDEDGRADRAVGDFYQLDVEMSFVTQDEIFATMEPIIAGVFKEFSNNKVTDIPFPKIKYCDAMLWYGCDKPDLRNPIKMHDVSRIFADSDFMIFAHAIKAGAIVKAIPAPKAAGEPRSFFDNMIAFAQNELQAKGLTYITFYDNDVVKGPAAKFLSNAKLEELRVQCGIGTGDSVFFVCDTENVVNKISCVVRVKVGEKLGLIAQNELRICWVTDYPIFEWNNEENKIDFSHNPFSMPQGGMQAVCEADTTEKKLALRAYQYDLVCNGYELSSGAIRNHMPELMYELFAIAGYDANEVDTKFGGLVKAFKYGTPPHGGLAPGIDRIVMLLADEPNLREVISFPLNQRGQDLLMNAPREALHKQLDELGLRVK